MANKRSTQIKNILARSTLDVHQYAGRTRHKIALLENAGGVDARFDNADAINTIYPLARFNADDVILDILYQQGASAGATDNDIGIYAAGDWTVADQAAINSAIDLLVDGRTFANAVALMASIIFNAGNATRDNYGKPLWQLAGLTTRPKPGTQYDVAIQKKTAAGAAALTTMNFRFVYAAGD